MAKDPLEMGIIGVLALGSFELIRSLVAKVISMKTTKAPAPSPLPILENTPPIGSFIPPPHCIECRAEAKDHHQLLMTLVKAVEDMRKEGEQHDKDVAVALARMGADL